MKPAPFGYVRARSVEEAADALANGDARILAGGQSLMPMLNFRLVKPAVLVDINRIPGLDRIELREGRVRLGATVRHRVTATDPVIRAQTPIVHAAMQHVAHLTVRNRGTFCGSVCHADPAAEMPLMTLLLDGRIEAFSVRGRRTIAARDFFAGALLTTLEPDEMVTSITIEALPPQTGWSFQEFAKRHGDFALASVAVTLEARDGAAANVRFGAMGVGETPLRLAELETLVAGKQVSQEVLEAVESRMHDLLQPNSDIHASADYRRFLAGRLARRALAEAWDRARAGQGG